MKGSVPEREDRLSNKMKDGRMYDGLVTFIDFGSNCIDFMHADYLEETG